MMAATALDNGKLCIPIDGGNGLWKSEKDVRRSGCLTEEFLNEFRMFKSEVSSPVSDGSVEDVFIDRLTQRLSLSDSRNVSLLDLHKSPEGFKVSGGSPQSTLGGIGSWSGRSSTGSYHNSPPATPFVSEDDTLRLIYAAADQVARLESNVKNPLQASSYGEWGSVTKPKPHHKPNAGFYADLQMKQKYMAAAREASDAALIWELHLQNMKRPQSYCNSRSYGTTSEQLNQSAWQHLQHVMVALKPNFQAVTLQRKESAGTGVFIPRRYEANSNVPPRKRTVAPCTLVPAKVVQALNTSIETMSTSLPHCNTVTTSASLSQQSYDALMGRRHALLDQQHTSMTRRTDEISCRSVEACLPQEWSY